MEAGGEIDPAHLLHLDLPPRSAEFERPAFQRYDAMRYGMKMRVSLPMFGGEVIDENYSGVLAGKVLLQRQHLPPVAKRVLREETQLGKAVEHEALRPDLLNPLHDQVHGGAELNLPWVKDCLLASVPQHLLDRGEFEDVNAIQRPSVGCDHSRQFLVRLRQCDVQRLFASPDPFQQELKAQGRLTRAGCSFQKIDSCRSEASTQYKIQTRCSGRESRVLQSGFAH